MTKKFLRNIIFLLIFALNAFWSSIPIFAQNQEFSANQHRELLAVQQQKSRTEAQPFLPKDTTLVVNSERKVPLRRQRMRSMLGIGVYGTFGFTSSDFFERYRWLTSSSKFELAGEAMWNFFTKFEVSRNDGFWLGLSFDTYKLSLNDQSSQVIEYAETGKVAAARTISNTMLFRVFPILTTFEYRQPEAKYRSFIGAGVGAGVVRFAWTESVSTTLRDDIRRGGEYFQDTYLVPAGRLYAGVELDFDPGTKASFVKSLTIQGQWNVMPFATNYFAGYAQQFDPTFRVQNSSRRDLSELTGAKSTLQLGGFSFGVTVNFMFAPS